MSSINTYAEQILKLSILRATAIISVGGIVLLWMYFDLTAHTKCTCSNSKSGQILTAELRMGAITRNHTRNLLVSKLASQTEEPSTSLSTYPYLHRDFVVTEVVTEVVIIKKKPKQPVQPVQPPVRLNETAANCTLEAIKSNGYYIITMLSVFNGNPWAGYENFTLDDLTARDNEYLQSLEHNINHELVKEVHLFYNDDATIKVVMARNFRNKKKIVPVKSGRKLHMADFFLYASRKLLDKPVIAMNGDILLGGGFQYINTTKMRDEKVLYSLSRYNVVDLEKPCTRTNWQLAPGYEASHDTHIFRLAEPLDENIIFDYLDYPINMWGSENAMIWTLRFALNFTVRNPCPVLSTFHNHCSKVHGPSQDNIEKHKYSIYYIPNKGWTKQHVLDSFADFEQCLNYAEGPSEPKRLVEQQT